MSEHHAKQTDPPTHPLSWTKCMVAKLGNLARNKKVVRWLAAGAVLLAFLLDAAFCLREVPGADAIWTNMWLKLGAWGGFTATILLLIKDGRHLVNDIIELWNSFKTPPDNA